MRLTYSRTRRNAYALAAIADDFYDERDKTETESDARKLRRMNIRMIIVLEMGTSCFYDALIIIVSVLQFDS